MASAPIAANPFFTIPGKHKATIHAKLTKRGRALLRRAERRRRAQLPTG